MPPVLSAAPPQVPDYALLRVVGRGAYGDVWLARSLTGIFRAVKIVWRSRFPDSLPYEREFNGLREFARVSINESRQLALLHVGRNDAAGFFYYVMELADDAETGRAIDPQHYAPLTLKLFRDQARQLSTPEVVGHAVELVRALASLHAHGLVHRDIKPSNLILVEGRPKLADIGLVANSADALTFVGTEGFVPPEGAGTPAADVYSLGKVLYELATGRDRNDYPRLPPNLQERPDRGALMELNEVIVRACDPSPASRYPDAEAMLNDLLLLQAGRSVRRLRLTERGLARARRAAIALTLVAAIAAAAVHYERQRAEQAAAARVAAEAERDLLAWQTVYSATLTQVQRALELGDFGRARRFLQAAIPAGREPDLRGLEWHLLAHDARGDPAEVITNGRPHIEQIVLSANGGRVAVHDTGKVVTIHQTGLPQPLEAISAIHRLAGFSPSGDWLLGTTSDFLLQAWATGGGQPLGAPQADGANRPLAVMPQAGARLLTFVDGAPGQAPGLRIWDLLARREVSRLNLPSPDGSHWEFFAAATSGDAAHGSLVLMKGRKNDVLFRELDVDLRRMALRSDTQTTQRRTALAVSADGNFLARANGNLAQVEMMDRHTGQLAWSRELARSDIIALAFSPSGDHLAAGTMDGELHLVRVENGSPHARLRGQAATVGVVTWAADGRAVFSAGSGGDVRRWAPPFPRVAHHLDGLWTSLTWRVACSAEGDRFAASLDERTVGIFDASTLDPVAALPGAQQVIDFLGESVVLALDPAGVVQWWRIGEDAPFDELDFAWPEGSRTMHVRVDAAEHVLVAASSDGLLQIWELPERRLRATIEAHRGSIRNTELSADGHTAATTGPNGRVCVWDVPTASLRFVVELPPPLLDLALSRDAAWLAITTGDGDVLVVHVPARRIERRLGLTASAAGALFSPDGSRLICASRAGLLHVFDTAGWRELATLEDRPQSAPGDRSVAAMNASANGRILVTLARNGRLRIWRRH